jgi:hypothetical protein
VAVACTPRAKIPYSQAPTRIKSEVSTASPGPVWHPFADGRAIGVPQPLFTNCVEQPFSERRAEGVPRSSVSWPRH